MNLVMSLIPTIKNDYINSSTKKLYDSIKDKGRQHINRQGIESNSTLIFNIN